MQKIKIYLVICQFLFALNAIGQDANHNDCPRCLTPEFINNRNYLINRIRDKVRLKSGGECDKKLVKLAIYYIQDRWGRKNFTATDDGMGDTKYTGKHFAEDMVAELNRRYAANGKLRIPPNNSIPINHKDIQFVIDGIYYLRNDFLNKYRDTQRVGNTYITRETVFNYNIDSFFNVNAVNKDSTLIILIQGCGTNARVDSTKPIGWRFDIGLGGGGVSMGYFFFSETYGHYYSYAISGKHNFLGMIGNTAGLWSHEIGHNLSLNHTVINLSGSIAPNDFCPTMKTNGYIDPDCDDGLPNSETPSAWYIMDTLNSPVNPADRSVSPSAFAYRFISNNGMDYGSDEKFALSPMQINLMHEHLDVTLQKTWLVEAAQRNDNYLCTWLGNRIAHYGKNVFVNRVCSPALRVLAKTNRKIFATGTTEFFNGFEVQGNAEFEVVNTCAKP
jgi:hypothetical protein